MIEEPLWQGDRDAGNYTPDLRRYEAILCYIGSPSDRAIEAVKAKTKYDLGPPKTKAAIAAATANAARNPDAVDRARDAGQIGGTLNGTSFIVAHQIRPTPDYGAVCPLWSPPDLPLQLDEGEAIDLAIPPKGRDALRKAREELIRKLEQAGAQYPADDWIAGQRVRFVADQRTPARTLQAAQACGATPVLCARLRAYAEEQAGHFALAEAEFRSVDPMSQPLGGEEMAAAIPPPANGPVNGPVNGAASPSCIDPETLLLFRESERRTITRGTCAEQRTLIDRMWWLADPLWSVNGNERYVAHQSRKLSASLRAIDDRDERYVWALRGGGAAMRELVVRYGWPGYTYWPGISLEEEINLWLEQATTRTVYQPHTAVEYSSDRTALIPSLSAILDPFALNASHWNLTAPDGKTIDEWWPQEHMMLFTKLAPLATGQELRLLRDSTIYYQLAVDDPLTSLDTAGRGASLASLSIGTSRGDTRVVANAAIGKGGTLRLAAAVPATPFVMSAEVLPRTLKERALRLRIGVHPPQALATMRDTEVALSEPVFLRQPNHDAPPPTELDAVLRTMAGGLEFPRTEPLAVYWESYGFAPGDSVHVRLRVRRNDDLNAARRIGAALGIVSELRDSLSVEWTEPDARHATLVHSASKPVVGRSIALDMQALPAGRYVVTIAMQRGTQTAESERVFTLRER